MTETPQPKESFLVRLQKRVGEIRNEAVAAWKGMDIGDVFGLVFGGGNLMFLGGFWILTEKQFGIAGTNWGGAAFVGAGATGLFLGGIKNIELGAREITKAVAGAVGTVKRKFTKSG